MIILPDISPFIQGREAAIQANWADRAKFEDIRKAQAANLLDEMGLEVAARLQPGSLASADLFSQYAGQLAGARTLGELDVLDYAQMQRDMARQYGPEFFNAAMANLRPQQQLGTQQFMQPTLPTQPMTGAYTTASAMGMPAPGIGQTTPEYFRSQATRRATAVPTRAGSTPEWESIRQRTPSTGFTGATRQLGINVAEDIERLGQRLGTAISPSPNTPEQNMAIMLANDARSGGQLLSSLQQQYPNYDWAALQQQAINSTEGLWRSAPPTRSQYPTDLFPALR